MQGGNISSDKKWCHGDTANSNIVLDSLMATQDGWVSWVKFFCKRKSKRAHVSKELKRKDDNELHAEQGHPSVKITCTIWNVLGLKWTGTFKPCEACTLCKAKKTEASKMAAVHQYKLSIYF